MVIEIKEVGYNDLLCFRNEDEAICPYCEETNYIEPDDYKGQDEETIEECGSCGKTFVHQINYKISFTSEPYENWVLREMDYCSKKIKEYKETSETFGKDAVEYFTKKLEKIKSEAAEIFR